MTAEGAIRPPAVAGRFYPAEAGALRRTVEDMLDDAASGPASDGVVCLVSPHAGYPYSGPTAAHAFGRIRGRSVNRVILLGCSHHFRIERASVFRGKGWETPLGVSPVDETFAAQLDDMAGGASDEPHYPEHSLETQLPFIQLTVGFCPVVPVLFGSKAGEWHHTFGAWLAERLEPGDVVVCSTDLSHFLSEEEAHAIDTQSLQAVLDQDIDAYETGIASGRYAMCGATAVSTAMTIALGAQASEWRLLDYRTSAQASGDRCRVVGYGALSMERVH